MSCVNSCISSNISFANWFLYLIGSENTVSKLLEGLNSLNLVLYFSKIAFNEGFKDVSSAFKVISTVEAEHEKRFRKLLENIETGKVFERDEKVKWVCRHCGYVHEGEKALENCPACLHPKAYFEVYAENY